MPEIEVRKAESEELSASLALVTALLQELGEEGDEAGELPLDALRTQLQHLGERHVIFIAVESSGNIVGVLTLSECFALYASGFYGVINEMYVVPHYRSAGVGGKLIRAALEFGQSRGWKRIDVTAPESERWIRSRQFYESQGFTFTGPKLKILLSPAAGSSDVS